MCVAIPFAPTCAAKSLTRSVRSSRSGRVSAGIKPTVRSTVGISVIFAIVGGADCGNSQVGVRKSLFPRRRHTKIEVATDAELGASDSEARNRRQYLFRIRRGPEEHSDFTFSQILHGIVSPFRFLDSIMQCINAMDCADSSGMQRSGVRP